MFEVQELLDFTIDFLHNSTADLKCCALVSVSWLAAAQYHLFSYIELGDDLACKRLGTVLEASPHLLRFIAHLAIEFHPHGDPYVALSKLHFTHLRKLTIYSLPPRWALPVMQNLCALPSILHISLMRPGDPLLFFSFLRHRTAKLKTFEVRGRLYPYGSSEESLVDATFIPHAERRIQVECLEITGVTRVVTECLAAPPFDFTSLKRLVILENLEPLSAERLAGMFVLLGPSLSHVEINGTIGTFHIVTLALLNSLPSRPSRVFWKGIGYQSNSASSSHSFHNAHLEPERSPCDVGTPIQNDTREPTGASDSRSHS
ncbi:hypothetical protein B0H10DRAFT_2099834 [Mycena sp. CBHHK59/15]|nr:hypothetical protein B0H10DRAFT_2099834 [Mycena sp. CBHHK59/15]